MALSKQTETFSKRLSQQLHDFSELSETLTLRILELEDRLTTIEANEFFSANAIEETTQKMFLESEQKIRHLQRLLIVDKQSDGDSDLQLETSSQQLVENDVVTDEEFEGTENIRSTHELISEDPSEEETFEVKTNLREDNLIDTQYVDDPQMPLSA